MSALTVTLANVKLLLGISDTTFDTPITDLMTLEQPALEYALDPAVLTYAINGAAALNQDAEGLLATLVMGVTEALAGSFLATAGRNPESLPAQITFRVATTEISQKVLTVPTTLGAQLVAVGLARLKPFSRSARSLARAAVGGDVNIDTQLGTPLVLGSGMGQAGSQPLTGGTQGPPPDSVFDRQLGTDGHTEPPGIGDLSPMPFGGFWGSGEP
jgi:hypothetical protein